MKNLLSLLAMLFCLTSAGYAQFTYTQVTSGLQDVYESGNTEFAIGDIDHDGDLDLISVGDHYSPLIPEEHGVMVFQNNGNGTAWTKVMNGDLGYGGVALGDVNNDGHMDVAYGVHHNYSSSDFGDQVLEVVLGDGTGTNWTPWDDNLGQQGQSWGMFGCDLADLNNDGLLDLGANSFGCCDGVWLYINNGDGTWTTYAGALDLNSGMQFRFADFDHDAKIDFVCANTQFSNQAGQVWKNAGNGQFISMQNGLPFNDYLFKLDVADVNNDGSPDLAVTHGGYARVFTWDIVNGTWVNLSNGLPASSQSVSQVALGDLDSDGYVDLMTFKSGLITIYKGDGAGNWTQAATLTVPETTCYALKLGDLDHNGYLDFAYWAKFNGSNMMRVYLNTSTATELSITPVYPKGGEFFCHGAAHFIRWISSVTQGNSATVTLGFSSTGPQGPFTTLASGIPNSGHYQWQIPSVSSVDCYLQLLIDDGNNTYTAVTPYAFSIDTCGNLPFIPGPISGATELCSGVSAAFSCPVTSGATSYTWTLPAGWTGSSVSNTITVTAGQNSGFLSVVANTPWGASTPQSLYVMVTAVDTSVTQDGITLTANMAEAAYQWIDCTTGTPIPNAVGQSFTPAVDGSYAVIVTFNDCSDTSSCYPVVVTGHPTAGLTGTLTLSPNPTGGVFFVCGNTSRETIEVYNLHGKMITTLPGNQARAKVDLTAFPNGMYYLRIRMPDGTVSLEVIKQ